MTPPRLTVLAAAVLFAAALPVARAADPVDRADAVAAARPAVPAELLRRGAELLQGGRPEEAAEAFREALKADPESEPARSGLAQVWAAIGSSHLQGGRLRQGREALEQAVDARPDNAEYLLLLARALFREGELRAARRETDRALELAPDNPAVRELSGDIHDREGELSLAVADWEAAAQAGGSHALALKAAKGRREMAAEEGMERESSRYFMILFDRDVPRNVVKEILPLLDDAFNTLHDKLGEYPRDEIKVLLYAKVAFRDITRAPDWAGGAYDGKIRIPVGGLATVGQAKGLLGILVHEMTHAFLFRMAPQGLPLWFHEGLATAFQGWDPATIRAWLAEHASGGVSTLDDLDRALLGRGGDVTAAYGAARLALAELEEIRGFGAIRRIIAGAGAGQPFAEVFESEMRTDLAAFQDRWLKALR